ncbi:MAG: hypothetical protein CSA35_02855 [Dethiosulfovibrio peptidovorans]|nr:MAG: hypothetical protein CSA35_02855 [Dethiosulfovibrio peptidovorans]
MSVIVQCCGGLGNQMFQYAFGRALALDIGTDLKLDISGFERGGRPLAVNAFHLSEDASFCGRSPFLPRLKMKLAQKMNKRNIKAFDCCFSDILLEPFPAYFVPACDFKIRPEKDVFVGGYWQSEGYFVHHADRIKRDFTLKDESSFFFRMERKSFKEYGLFCERPRS